MPGFSTLTSLTDDLHRLGLENGDGVFVHTSMSAIGPTIGGPRTVVEALIDTVGPTGLIAMPGFSSDAAVPDDVLPEAVTDSDIALIEDAVPGFDPATSPTVDIGIVAETFRTWPGTRRSDHPAVSVCARGRDAATYTSDHPLAWATGPGTPLEKLRARPQMKLLLIGVGWEACSALHTAETLAPTRRTKMRRIKIGGRGGRWVTVPDVANDEGRLFPAVGAAYQAAGSVTTGTFGNADCRICDYRALIDVASAWIDHANRQSGDRH